METGPETLLANFIIPDRVTLETELRVLVEKNMLPGITLEQGKIVLTYTLLRELRMDVALKSLVEELGAKNKVVKVGVACKGY